MIVSETVQEWQAGALERGRGEGKIEGLLIAPLLVSGRVDSPQRQGTVGASETRRTR